MADKVTYHQENGEDREYVVLAKNQDGTVDIGPEGGKAVVTSCQISEKPEAGKVTAAKASEEEKSQKKNSTK